VELLAAVHVQRDLARHQGPVKYAHGHAHGHANRPISVYRLGKMPIQSGRQSVSAPRGKAGARLKIHTELRAERQRSAREAIYRNQPIGPVDCCTSCGGTYVRRRGFTTRSVMNVTMRRA